MKEECVSEWEELSDGYDKRQGDTGDLWHRALIDPPVLQIIGGCHDQDILDLGCGNGYLARKIALQGARVTAVDSSARMINNARARDGTSSPRVRYLQGNASRLDELANASFDLVFANMSLMDIEDAKEAIGEVSTGLEESRKVCGKHLSSLF